MIHDTLCECWIYFWNDGLFLYKPEENRGEKRREVVLITLIPLLYYKLW